MNLVSDIRKKTIEGLRIGDQFTVRRTFTTQDVADFGRLSRDDNPVHSSAAWVAAKGFKKRICQGLLVAAMVTEVGGQIGWLASRMEFKFKRPVYIGDSVACTFTITDIGPRRWAKGDAQMVNQAGVEVIAAQIWGILPDRRERRLLKAIEEKVETTD